MEIGSDVRILAVDLLPSRRNLDPNDSYPSKSQTLGIWFRFEQLGLGPRNEKKI
jgi:hypothetical protein